MNKKGNLGMIMVGILVLVIIAMVAISVTWGTVTDQTKTTGITGDTFTSVNNTCVKITDNCISSLTSVINATNNVSGGQTYGTGNYTLCTTDLINGRSNGLKLLNVNYNLAGNSNASYSEISCQQVSGTTGSIINYIPALMAVILLIAVAFYIK